MPGGLEGNGECLETPVRLLLVLVCSWVLIASCRMTVGGLGSHSVYAISVYDVRECAERVRFSFCSGSPGAIVGWKQESGKRYLNPQLAISDLRSSVGRTDAQEKCRKCIGTLRHQLNL